MPKLYMKEINKEEDVKDIMTLLKDIPDKDIDHWETDLYLRKTPQVTRNVIDKLPNYIKNSVTQFRDNIDRDIWYEIPFIFPREKDRKGEEVESVMIPVKKLMIKESLYTVDNLKKLVRDMIMDKGFNTGMIRWDKSKNTLAISLAEENEDAYQWEVITVPVGKLIDYDDIDSISKYAEAIVDTVIGKYYDLVECVNSKSIKESLDNWDIEKIASMIEDCLYDRNFIVNRRKIFGSSIDFNVSYKYDNSHDNATVYTKDFENLPEDEWFDLARRKAEEIAEMVLDNDDWD